MGSSSRSSSSRTLVALASLLVLVLAGCTNGGDRAAPSDPPAATVAAGTEEATTEPSEDGSESPEPSESPSASVAEVLGEQYGVDSDGNAIPDFIEVETGHDPLADDCLAAACPGADRYLNEDGSEPVEQNRLLILDSSGSMAADDASGTPKIDAARAALERYTVGTPDTVNVGLLVYGHRGNNDESGRAESCAGIEEFAPLGGLDAGNAAGILSQFQPTGWTPVAGSLQRAAQTFAGREGADNRVILVTDGIETCDGDPIAAARALKESGIAVTVDVVGFDLEAADEAALRGVAEVTGGTYTSAADGDALNNYVDSLVREQGDAVQVFVCLSREMNGAKACNNGVARDARGYLVEQRDSTSEFGDPRYLAIEALSDEISARNEEIRTVIDERSMPAVDAAQAAFEVAQERYRERYGRSLTSLPPCNLM